MTLVRKIRLLGMLALLLVALAVPAASQAMALTQSPADLHLIFPVRLPAQLNQGYHDGHWSLDFSRAGAVKDREDVIAAHDGTLTSMVLKDGAVCAFVKNGDYQTAYCHLTANSIPANKLNTQVKQGDVIGKIGLTGKTTGLHVHFDLFNNRTGKYEPAVPMCGISAFPNGLSTPYIQYTQCSNQPITPAARYNNQPPVPSGCWTATTQTPKRASIRSANGQQIGAVELKWSTTCQTNWASVTSSIGTLTIREDVQSRNSPVYSDTDYSTTYGYSPMVYAPNTQSRACGTLIRGTTILGSACTDWY